MRIIIEDDQRPAAPGVEGQSGGAFAGLPAAAAPAMDQTQAAIQNGGEPAALLRQAVDRASGRPPAGSLPASEAAASRRPVTVRDMGPAPEWLKRATGAAADA